jgi:ADP-ribose pyrophosphatase
MKTPKLVGSHRVLIPMKWNKTLISQGFSDKISGEISEFTLFHSPSVCQIVFGLTRKDEVIAIKQFRHGVAVFQDTHNDNPFVLELPGGGPNPSERYEDAATREFIEETGYRGSRLLLLSNGIWHDPSCSTLRSIPWLTTDCDEVFKQHTDPEENIEVLLIPIQKWVDMIFSGQIIDSRTIAVTMLALPHIDTLRSTI